MEVLGACPVEGCGMRFGLVKHEGQVVGMAHDEPMCETFSSMDPAAYLAWTNLVIGAPHRPGGSA